MKKFITMIIFALCAVAVHAQFGAAYQFPVVAGDTITNTGTANKVFTITAGYTDIAIQPVITKVSGTMAGTVKVYGSVDGSTYSTFPVDTMNIAETNLSKVMTKSGTPYYKYKVIITGSGTMVARWKLYYIVRKRIAQ